MKSTRKAKPIQLTKQAYKIRVIKTPNDGPSIEDAPFFKEKMKKAQEILSRVGLPEGY